jgi:hypothetical protein
LLDVLLKNQNQFAGTKLWKQESNVTQAAAQQTKYAQKNASVKHFHRLHCLNNEYEKQYK